MTTTHDEPPPLVLGEDYYIEDGLLVMTATHHKKRGSCCGSGCRWCPFEPRHELGATKLVATSSISANDNEQGELST